MDIGRRGLLGSSIAAGSVLVVPAARALAVPSASAHASSDARRRVALGSGWRFHFGHATDVERDFGFGRNQRTFAKAGVATADAAMAKFDDRNWREVRVPHDWAVDLPFVAPSASALKGGEDAAAAHGFKAIGRDHPENSVGWYRRSLEISSGDRGRSVWLEFDGVFRDSTIFVNGYVAGRSESGYAPFGVQIDDFLDYDGGANVIAVRCDASLGEGWFYEGAGIYRDVRLVSAAPVHVPQWGVFVRAEVKSGNAQVSISAEIANDLLASESCQLSHRIVGPAGSTVAATNATSVELAAGQTRTVEATAVIDNPLLWSLEERHLYRLISEVHFGGVLVDEVETRFGIRSIAFEPERGFFLNGQHVELRGMCNHQDHAGVGAGIPDALHAWRVAQLQAFGANAWRSAHNPPAQALLNACDEMGMLMVAEARLNSTSEDARDELSRLVRSCRNHPSVILWSVGNEEPHQGSAKGARISAEMVAQVKALDPTRPTTQAFDQHFGEGASQVVDVVGFNYRTDKIEAFHRTHPMQPTLGTETGSTVSTRGAYANDAARHIVRAYDTEHPWWASTAEEWWSIVAERRYISGGFVWTGFDYRGEPTPFSTLPSVSSYFGVLDLCGFPKDNAAYYRSQWRSEPMVHLLPHWNWPGREGQPIEVWAYSNCDEVELLVNGRSAGRRPMPRHGHLAWPVPYRAGQIEARGYSSGRMCAADRRVTVGPPHAIRITSDRGQIAADERDVAMIRAAIVDAAGREIPIANNLVRFDVSGSARLIGVGNGDPTSTEADRGEERRAFNGLCQAIVQSNRQVGRATITVSSVGLLTSALRVATI